tara:strand:- start:1012 stop:2859 length:1848 start_codon:yes stop_codon:yes gene_type:complete
MRGCAIAPRVAVDPVLAARRRTCARRPARPEPVAATAERRVREPASGEDRRNTISLMAATAALTLAPGHPADAAEFLPEIVASFNLATFTPQVFWFAMILAPRNPVVKTVMGSWLPVLIASGIHFYVDYVGFNQPGALEEAAKFGAVFDPTIAPWDWANGAVTGPLLGFQSMLENPNFVTEEWAHVLAWDLFVGRWMWLDAIERDVPFLWACLLTTNFTGPPGLLQYFVVCLLSGKGLPPAGASSSSSSSSSSSGPSALPPMDPPAAGEPDAGALVTRLWDSCAVTGRLCWSARDIVAACAENVEWEDLSFSSKPIVGRAAVFAHLAARQRRDEACGSRLVVERACDGRTAAGFTWHRSNDGGDVGLRGTTFVEVDGDGRVVYVREIAEPLFKPGGGTARLLRAVAKPPAAPPAPLGDARRQPASASDLVAYLWLEVQGAADFRAEAARYFDKDIVYQDLNFDLPFVGLEHVASFLEEFDIPGLTFVPDRISDGEESCCFTWEVDLGVEGAARVKGVSFYECESIPGMIERRGEDGVVSQVKGKEVRVTYVRDIPESTLKPPPLQALAAAIKPDLRTFKPLLREQQAVAESCSVNAMACRTSTGDMRPDDKKLRG